MMDNPYQPPKSVGQLQPIGDARITIRPRRSFLGWAALAACGANPRGTKEGRLFCDILAELHGLPQIPRSAAVVSLRLGTPVPQLRRRTRHINADDIGFAYIAGDRLRFLGDAVSVNLSRGDIHSLGKAGILLGHRMRIELASEIACQNTLTLVENSGLAGIGPRARAFRNSLTTWHSQASS